jgi:ankyrin repeat protein
MRPRLPSDPVVEAAERGDVPGLTRLLGEAPSAVHLRTGIGDTPLHCAAAQGRKGTCLLLLQHGADVNAVGNHGGTPLHCAAASGSVPVAKLLLENGARVDAIDGRGQTPLAMAVGHLEVGRPETSRMVGLLKKHSGGLDLRSAIRLGDIRRVRALLRADPQAISHHPDPGGLLLDAVTCQEENVGLIRSLLEAGADPNRYSGCWPELPISRVSSLEVAELLLKHGADPNVTDNQGRTPLQRARKFKLKELEQVFRRYGGTLPARKPRGK